MQLPCLPCATPFPLELNLQLTSIGESLLTPPVFASHYRDNLYEYTGTFAFWFVNWVRLQ